MNSQSKEVQNLMSLFMTHKNEPFINKKNELILYPEFNIYFRLDDVNDERDLKAKVIAWLSKPAHNFNGYDTTKYDYEREESVPYKYGIKKNKEVQNFIFTRMNEYLNTNFTYEEMVEIYCVLGNDIKRELTYKFIDSGYDMEVLKNGSRN